MILHGNNFINRHNFPGYRMPTDSDFPGSEETGMPEKKTKADSVKDDKSTASSASAKASFDARSSLKNQEKQLDLAKYFPEAQVRAEMTSLGCEEKEIVGFMKFISELGSQDLNKIHEGIQEILQLGDKFDEIDKIGDRIRDILADTVLGENSYDHKNFLKLYPYLNGLIKDLDQDQVDAVQGNLIEIIVWFDGFNNERLEDNKAELSLLYLHMKLYSGLKNDDSVAAHNKKHLESCLEDSIAFDLNSMGWQESVYSGKSLEDRLISLASVTEDKGLRELLANSTKTGILQDRDSFLPSEMNESNLLNYIWNQIDLRLAGQPKVSEDELVNTLMKLRFKHELRTMLDPVTNEAKRTLWDNPISSILDAVQGQKNFVYVPLNPLTSVDADHDQKLVDLDFKPKLSNSIQAQLQLFEGLVQKGFRQFNIDLSEYIFYSNEQIALTALVDSKDGEGSFKRDVVHLKYQHRVKDEISSLVEDFFANKNQDSFLRYLQNNGYLQNTKEIPFELANFINFVNKLNVILNNATVKIYNEEQKKKHTTGFCLDSKQKAVYVVAKRAVNERTMALSEERMNDTVIVRHSLAHDSGFSREGKDLVALRERGKTFNYSVPKLHTELADQSGYGDHQTVATKRDKDLEQLYYGENYEQGHGDFITLSLPDYLLTTVNSDSDEQDIEELPGVHEYDDAPVNSDNLVPSR